MKYTYKTKCPICGQEFEKTIYIDDAGKIYESVKDKLNPISEVPWSDLFEKGAVLAPIAVALLPASLLSPLGLFVVGGVLSLSPSIIGGLAAAPTAVIGQIKQSLNKIIPRKYHCDHCNLDWTSKDENLEQILKKNWEEEYTPRKKQYPLKPVWDLNIIKMYKKELFTAIVLSGAAIYALASLLIFSWIVYLISLSFWDFTSFAWFVFSKGILFGVLAWVAASYWKYNEYVKKKIEYEKEYNEQLAKYEQEYKIVSDFNSTIESELEARIKEVLLNNTEWEVENCIVTN